MPAQNRSSLCVSRFDKVQSVIVSAIFVFGVLFMILFAIWWTQELHASDPGGITFPPDGTQQPLNLVNLDLDESDFDFLTPTVAPRLSNDLKAVTDIVSQVYANDVTSKIDGEISDGTRDVGPTGLGGTPGKGTLPNPLSESNRWSVVYENPDVDDYLSMLIALKIELGIVRLHSNQVIRIKQPGIHAIKIQSNREQESQSFYFTNTKPTARRWDRQIAQDAAIDTGDSSVVHFYPPMILQQMRAAEAKRIKQDGKTVKDVVATEFIAVAADSGFEFQVQHIEFRQ